ncbi:hypothetical protein [Flectobacillus rivi]|uniref:VCBS repeat-containing protein n=1 Tax=Flectobacillus rivi TaxID=2984209 RepID=A0ABT6YVQ1_9BACT|nr:hypothetical protein [Flectobacillus rivi]MDI9872893.1 hypothetical protein [Flectobacillus rivi]
MVTIFKKQTDSKIERMKIFLTLLSISLLSTVFGQARQKENPTEFLPKGFFVYETIRGDLNRDGIEDCILIIKGTDKNKIITDKYSGQLDRNRRGIIILFKKNNHYELVLKNQDCFSSENEDGGVYFAPELSIEIKNGNLTASYGHGRYGSWSYKFKYKNGDFELIGYDANSNRGPVAQYQISINFLTKKKLRRDNLNKDADGDEEYEDKFMETWKKINIKNVIKLSNIKDFDELDMTKY